MNNLKKMLVLILSVTIILPVVVLSGCAGLDGSNKGGESTITSPRTQAVLQLAFAGNRDGKYALFIINIDGSGEKQITSRPACDYVQSSWSPDGTLIAAKRILILGWPYQSQSDVGIVTINLNNGTETKFTNFIEDNGDSGPAFSPYGNLIIFGGPRGLGTYNLGGVRSSIDVSQPGKFGINDMYLGSREFNPSVSPEPIKIAFEANVAVEVALLEPSTTPTIPPSSDGAGVTSGAALSGGGGEPTLPYQDKIGEKEPGKRICVVDFDGTNLKQLTTSKEKYDDTYPTWSPDGKRIAFMSNRAGGKNQIYVMNADGTGQTQITNDNFENHDPAWSPDGAYIAYVSDHSGISDLVIIRPDGTGRQRVNKVNELVKTPSWRPLSGQVFDVSPTISTPSTPPVTTNPPGTTIPLPQTPVNTTGQLFISASGTNGNYSIYVNGASVGQNSVDLTLPPGSYRVTIYNRNGTKVYDQTSTVITGKTSQVKISGAG